MIERGEIQLMFRRRSSRHVPFGLYEVNYRNETLKKRTINRKVYQNGGTTCIVPFGFGKRTEYATGRDYIYVVRTGFDEKHGSCCRAENICSTRRISVAARVFSTLTRARAQGLERAAEVMSLAILSQPRTFTVMMHSLFHRVFWIC